MNECIHDPVLGELERYDAGSYRLTLHQTELYVAITEDAPEQQAAILQARKIVEGFTAYTERATRYVCAELLAIKNGFWLQGDEEPLDAAEFTRQLNLSLVSVERDGRATLYFDDNQMFGGHSIVVYANVHDEFETAKLEG